MMNKRYVVYGVLTLIIVLGSYLWYKHGRKQDRDITNTVLKPIEKEKIIVDPLHHKITIIKENSEPKHVFFDDRPMVIVLRKDNKIVIENRTMGFEFRPFIGGVYGDEWRLSLGVDTFFIHRFDLGITLAATTAISPLPRLRLLSTLGYNVYSNTSVFIGADPVGLVKPLTTVWYGGIKVRL